MESKNPNETILIPLLNKRLTDLVVANILTEAKLLYCEEEKTELKTLLEKEQTAAQQFVEENSSRFSEALQEQTQSIRDACEQEKTAVQQAAEHSKQEIAKNWSQELATQTGNLNARINGLVAELQSSKELIQAAEHRKQELATQTGNLNARINGLVAELQSSKELIDSLRKEIQALTVPAVVVEEKTTPQPKRNSKKLTAAMSNDTY